MSLRHQLPQALFLSFLAFTPSHEITLGMRGTATISEVPVNNSPLGQRADQLRQLSLIRSHLLRDPPFLKKGLP